jgi:hypothetical protein
MENMAGCSFDREGEDTHTLFLGAQSALMREQAAGLVLRSEPTVTRC